MCAKLSEEAHGIGILFPNPIISAFFVDGFFNIFNTMPDFELQAEHALKLHKNLQQYCYKNEIQLNTKKVRFSEFVLCDLTRKLPANRV